MGVFGRERQACLFDGDGRSPVLFDVYEAETDSAARVDIGMEESVVELALGWERRVVARESHPQFVHSSFPQRLAKSETSESKT